MEGKIIFRKLQIDSSHLFENCVVFIFNVDEGDEDLQALRALSKFLSKLMAEIRSIKGAPFCNF